MPPRLAKYNPDQVSITVGGVLIQGYADGEFVTVEQITPSFDEVVGTDGEVARSRTSDKRLKVVVKLLQTSQSNAILTAVHNDDVNDPAGITVECQIEDTLGGSIAYGAESWVTEIPAASYDRTAKSREWEIHIANGTREEAGN